MAMQISAPSAARLQRPQAGGLQQRPASPAPWRIAAVPVSTARGLKTGLPAHRPLHRRFPPLLRATGPSDDKEPEGQLEQFRRLFEQVAAWRQREAERQRLMDEALVEPDSSGGGAEGSESPADGTSTAGSSSSAASDEPAAAGPSAASDKPGVAGPNAVDGGPAGSAGAPVPIPVERPAADPFPGREAEEVGQVEPLAAQGAAAAEDVLFTAEQLASGAAGAAEDASDAMTAAQRAAQRAVGDVASDAADAAAAAQRAAQRAAADVASDANDAMTATQRAAERMLSGVQQQATQAAASAVQGTAEAMAAAAAEAAGAASAVAAAAGSAAAPASRPQGQLSAPAGPAGALQAPEPPAGSLNAPKPPAGSLAAPQPPAGSLAAPEQPVASLPPPAAEAPSEAASSGSGTSSSGSGAGSSSSSARVGRGSGAAERAEEIAAVKQQLVSMLASLDRGAAATEDQAQRVDNLARRLELLGGTVALDWNKPANGGKPGMALLDGRWRLLFSSGFTSGSLGGRRPGPSFGSLPLTLGPVYQDIYTDKCELDNVVELFLRFSIASLPGVSGGVPSATARLRHSFQIIGSNTIEITFDDTEVKLAGGLQGWLDNLPTFTTPKLPQFLQTPKGLRSARFDVVFMDETMRITRGDRDELRVFLKGAV